MPLATLLTRSSLSVLLQDCFQLRYVLMGLLYTLVFHALWLVSREFETVLATVSWYLPAGMAGGLLGHVASGSLYSLRKTDVFCLFSPGAMREIGAFPTGNLTWVTFHIVLSPAILLYCAWQVKRHGCI